MKKSRHLFTYEGYSFYYDLVDLRAVLDQAGFENAAGSTAIDYLYIPAKGQGAPCFHICSEQDYRHRALIIETIIRDENFAMNMLGKKLQKVYQQKSHRIAAEAYAITLTDKRVLEDYVEGRLRMYEFIFEYGEDDAKAYHEAYDYLLKQYHKLCA